MSKSLYVLLFSLFFVMVSSCTSGEQKSPEDRVRDYAQLINQGKLEQAKKICTPSGKAFLDALDEIIIASNTSLDTSEIIIKQISCDQTNDTTLCTTIEYDGFEEYSKKYWLIHSIAGWLIDHPANMDNIENSEEILEEETARK